MSETRKIAAILVSDVVGYSRLAGADEDRILARLRALRSDLIDPTISVHRGRIVKRTGDGSVIEFRSVVDAVRCAIEVQHAMVERNAGVALDKRHRIPHRHSFGRCRRGERRRPHGRRRQYRRATGGRSRAGRDLPVEDAYRQVKGRLDLAVIDLGPTQLKNIADPIRVYSLEVERLHAAKPMPPPSEKPGPPRYRSSSCHSPISAATRSRSISSTGSRRASRPICRAFAARYVDRPQHGVHLQGQAARREDGSGAS